MGLFKSMEELNVMKITLFLKIGCNHTESIALSVLPCFCLPGPALEGQVCVSKQEISLAGLCELLSLHHALVFHFQHYKPSLIETLIRVVKTELRRAITVSNSQLPPGRQIPEFKITVNATYVC